jgi:myo-inositol-1(or 4)-monophosphatase
MVTAKQVSDIVVRLADEIFNKKFEVEQKGGYANIVTSNDKLMQEALMEEFKKILPEAGFLCEEEDAVNIKEYTWVIDPIDGTQNYRRHIYEACVSVGLMHNGEPILGVVYEPFLKDLFTAEKGKGAYKNGEPIHVSSRPWADALLCTAMPVYSKPLAKVCNDIIYDAFTECNDFRRFGTCAFELCLLAEGKIEAFFELKLWPWDFVGAEVILKEAGGDLKGLEFGEVNRFGPSPLIGANNPETLKRLTEIVAKHVSKDIY